MIIILPVSGHCLLLSHDLYVIWTLSLYCPKKALHIWCGRYVVAHRFIL